jgi:hypothetical protein
VGTTLLEDIDETVLPKEYGGRAGINFTPIS